MIAIRMREPAKRHSSGATARVGPKLAPNFSNPGDQIRKDSISMSGAITICANCEAPLAGPFCSNCGQKASPHLSVHDFAHELVHEFLHFDGKILRTMQALIFRPGLLTRDYVEGRRARYISPIRLYLVWSLVFVTLLVTTEVFTSSIRAGDETKAKEDVIASVRIGDQGEDSWFSKRMMAGVERVNANPGLLTETLAHSIAKTMFFLMPLFALVVMLFYRRTQPYYVPHLYFAIHVHAFAFFLYSVALGLVATHVKLLASIATPLPLLLFPYSFVAFRRTYGGSWPATVGKGLAIHALYSVVLLAGMVVVVISLAAISG